MLVSINPATGNQIQEYSELTELERNQRVQECADAFPAWRDLSYQARGKHLKSVAAQLRANQSHLANLMTIEMGKPVKEALAEVEKAAWCLTHYADQAEAYLADEVIESDASLSYVHYQPLGPVLGIMPWNAPLWVTFRFLAPALMAGNTCVMKHDTHVQGCAKGILDAFAQAKTPENILVNLPISNPDVEKVIRHPLITAVSFTGSSRAGGIVASIAGSEVKPSVLELGGSDPCVILADADLEQAVSTAVLSRMINAGQSCIAAKRIIVENSVYDTVVQKAREHLLHLKVGDPQLEETDIGPIAREDLRTQLHRQVSKTIQDGAICELGGQLPQGDGYFYPVTLLVDVPESACGMREEVFGPVMLISRAKDADEALRLSNQTMYGLGGAIWTKSQHKAQQFIAGLNCGQVAVNGIVKTDPRLPSGGVKGSGYGRELGAQGIHAFVNAKQVWIR